MQIDMAYADRITQRVVTETTGTFLRTLDGATVVDEIELLGVVAGRLSSEINDLMQNARLRVIGASSGNSGGITPDATGTLADRSVHNGEAEGFAYLATDQTPAEYYFRQGGSGWSPAVTVRGPTGATGPQGPQGIQGPPGADGITFVAGTAAPNNADGRPDGTVYVRHA